MLPYRPTDKYDNWPGGSLSRQTFGNVLKAVNATDPLAQSGASWPALAAGETSALSRTGVDGRSI